MSAVTVEDGRASMPIETYADLLAVRAVPEWRLSGGVATFDAIHLEALGLAETAESAEYDIAPRLFDYQAWTVRLALERQRFAAFMMTGMGKTVVGLEWARHVVAHGRVLIVAPLNVCHQWITEAEKFYGLRLQVLDATDRGVLNYFLQCERGIAITNYEKLDGTTEPLPIAGLVLDESSVLKQSMGARRTSIIAAGRGLRWKLALSATPAPNDRLEYAEHAYFLDVVRSTREFLAAFFVNRDGEWQLKHHGEKAFYRHLASWSVFMRDPRAYGFDDHTMDLPTLSIDYQQVALTPEQMARARVWERGKQASLFGATPGGVTSRTKMLQIANGFELVDGHAERFSAIKPAHVAEIANERHGDERVIVWTNYDAEAAELGRLIPDAVVLSGKTPIPERSRIIDEWSMGGGVRVLVAKTAMFSAGLNLQACRVMVFSSMTDSFERWFQAIRRCYRYGQEREVLVYVPLTQLDQAICENVLDKEHVFLADAAAQEAEFVAVLRPKDTTERRTLVTLPKAELDRATGVSWTMVQGDCVAHMPTMAEESMDLAVFSPPFANLFVYSSEAGDMGNVRSDDEYRLQWEFFCPELFRVMKAGRQVILHCQDVQRFAGQYGYRYTYDYPSDLRAAMERAGFLYRSRITIDVNPQQEAIRTKASNLLFVTLKRDALQSHPIAHECILLFTKPGDPETRVIADGVSTEEWITWAHPVWYDIREGNVLNVALSKEHDHERHVCPLQLGLIERCVRLWTNKGETVFSPFAGIGSEGYESLKWGRRFYGIELKRSYFETACRFLAQVEVKAAIPTLLDVLA